MTDKELFEIKVVIARTEGRRPQSNWAMPYPKFPRREDGWSEVLHETKETPGVPGVEHTYVFHRFTDIVRKYAYQVETLVHKYTTEGGNEFGAKDIEELVAEMLAWSA